MIFKKFDFTPSMKTIQQFKSLYFINCIFKVMCLCLLISSCSARLNLTDIKKVKKVAIIGYDAKLNIEEEGISLSYFRDRELIKENAILAYQQMVTALAKKMGWEVVTYNNMISNSEYSAVYQEVLDKNILARMETSLGKLSMNYYPDGVIMGLYADNLSDDQRSRLYKSMGVDAIATAQITITASSTTKVFFSSHIAYSAQVNFKLRNQTSDKPIWSDLMATGKAADVSSGLNFGPVIVRNDDQKAFLQAIERGYVALLNRYDKAVDKNERKSN